MTEARISEVNGQRQPMEDMVPAGTNVQFPLPQGQEGRVRIICMPVGWRMSVTESLLIHVNIEMIQIQLQFVL